MSDVKNRTKVEVHPTKVEGWNGSLPELAQAIAQMRYDKVAELFHLLAVEFNKQANNDRDKGRRKLAAYLDCATEICNHGRQRFEEIWKVCRPFMRKTS